MNVIYDNRSGSVLKIGTLKCLRISSLACLIIVWVIASVAYAQEPPKTMSRISYPVKLVVKRCESARAAGVANFLSAENASVRVSSQGEIELVFHAIHTAGSEEAKQLESLGARVVSILEMPPELMLAPMGMIRAWVPFDTVEEAADLPWVATVMAPDRGVPDEDTENPIKSEGVELHNADLAHQLGVTGSGVTIGVISDGVDSLTDAQDREELPDVTVLMNDEGDEGTAMLEVVHDMAPDATLMFHSTGVGVDGHMDAFHSLFLEGVNIIADDISFLAEPVFQQGRVASAREALARTGLAVHSSAGNYGDEHPARVLAIGTGSGPDGIDDGFVGCSIDPTNVVVIAPDGDTTFDMVVGPNTVFGLQWSEPRAVWPTGWAGGFTDLDLYLMDATGTVCLGESLNPQGGGSGDTFERISTVNAGIAEGTLVKVVVNVFDISGAVAAPILDVHWIGKKNVALDMSTRAGSITGDKNYTGLAYSIGAVYQSNAQLADSSSAGPVELTLTTVCPGDFYPCETGVAGTSTTYQGVDFLGATGVSISGVGGFGSEEVCCPAEYPGDCLFYGTSAAAPHTAACEALLRSLPSFGALAPLATTRARLAATAIDYPPTGEDSVTGAGLLDCLAAIGPPDANCATPTVPTDPGVCFATGVSIDNGSSDPFGQFIMVTQDPSGPYDLGITAVYLTVTDADNLEKTCVSRVLVEDHEVPTIIAPADILAECETPEGTKVYLGSPESLDDNCDDALFVMNDGVLEYYPPGVITLMWTATDDSGNFATDTQDITVVDTTPPTIVAPPNIVAECEGPDGTKVYLGSPESLFDICDETLFVTNDSTMEFHPIGLTTVTWTATDDSGNSGIDTQDIMVADTTPPDLSVVMSQDTIWPPNHKLVKVTATVNSTDTCEAEPEIQLVSVSSNEADDGSGDGAMNDDIVIIDDFTFKVRAERSGVGESRIYTFTYQATDASGNVTVETATVTVPHDDDE